MPVIYTNLKWATTDAYMQLGAEAAAASSQRLVRWMKLPFFPACFGAPAAC